MRFMASGPRSRRGAGVGAAVARRDPALAGCSRRPSPRRSPRCPYDRSVLRHEVDYRFRGPLGGFGARASRRSAGRSWRLKRGVLAQKREIEAG